MFVVEEGMSGLVLRYLSIYQYMHCHYNNNKRRRHSLRCLWIPPLEGITEGLDMSLRVPENGIRWYIFCKRLRPKIQIMFIWSSYVRLVQWKAWDDKQGLRSISIPSLNAPDILDLRCPSYWYGSAVFDKWYLQYSASLPRKLSPLHKSAHSNESKLFLSSFWLKSQTKT